MERSEEYENEHVHLVYEEIASHFSSTRYKPWPLVERFLGSLSPGSIGIDIGCGNGKYLPINKDIFIVASDRSSNLVRIAKQHKSHETLVADALEVPHPPCRFDFVISIAVVHHLSTRDRRRGAIDEILKLLRLGKESKALLYVWALEQKSSRRGWDAGDEQDIMVPWTLRTDRTEKTLQRYYHLYRRGELEEDIVAVGGVVLDSGYEKDNWWAIAAKI